MSELTVEKLLAVQRQIQSLAPRYDIPEIRESEHAVQRLQAKIYPKRKAKNASHLRRMNNKWLKRYGYTLKPAAFMMDTSLMGGIYGRNGRKIMFVHPMLMAEVRRAFPADPLGEWSSRFI